LIDLVYCLLLKILKPILNTLLILFNISLQAVIFVNLLI